MTRITDEEEWYFFTISSLQREIKELKKRNFHLVKESMGLNKLKEEVYNLKCQLSKFDDSMSLTSIEVDYALKNLTKKRDEYFDFAKIEIHSSDEDIFMKSFLKGKGSFGMRLMTHEKVGLSEDGKKTLTEHVIEDFVKELEVQWGLYIPRWRRPKEGEPSE